MPLGISATLSEEDIAELEKLRDPNEEPLPGAEDDAPPTDKAPADQPPSDKPEVDGKTSDTPPADDEDAKAATAAEQQQDTKPKGNVNQALRAARAAERQAREKLAAVNAELEELRKKIPAESRPTDMDELTDADIAELESDFPAAAKAARLARKAAAQLAALQGKQQESQPAAAPAPDFEPQVFPEAVQTVIDGNEDLLAWQYDPDQTRFEMAKAADALLMQHPKWKDKPLAERFNEAVRRVNAELAEQQGTTVPTPKPGRKDPAEVIRNAPTRTPSALGDIGSGSGKQAMGSDLGRYSSMSAEDIEAELMTRGG